MRHLSRAWAIEEDGMLRRNNLISKEQVALLSEWIDCISYAVMVLFEGNEDEAFEPYEQYQKITADNML